MERSRDTNRPSADDAATLADKDVSNDDMAAESTAGRGRSRDEGATAREGRWSGEDAEPPSVGPRKEATDGDGSEDCRKGNW